MYHRERLKSLLLERSVRLGSFTLSSGGSSDYYVDARRTTMTAEGQCLIGRLALEIFGPESREYASFADTNFRLAMTAGVAVGATEVQLNLIASRFLELPKE